MRIEKGEMVTALIIPKRSTSAKSGFLKLGARRYLVISIAMVAGGIDCGPDGRIDHARVAVGSCSEVAQRLPALEAALIGLSLDPGIAQALTPEMLSVLSPIDDVRGDAAYRQHSAEALVTRLLSNLGAAA